MNRVLVILIALAAAPPAAALDIRVSHVDNVRYQLDCLAQLIRCTEPESTLAGLISPTELDQWRSARQVAPTYALSTDTFGLPTAADLTQVRTMPEPLAESVDAQRSRLNQRLLDVVVARTETRWRSDARHHLARMAVGLEVVADRVQLESLLDDYATLFDVRSEIKPVVRLIALTGSGSGSLASLSSDVAYVETPFGDSPANRLPVLVHEYVHQWQSRMPREQRREIIDAFVQSANPCAITTHHFFDEAIASAIGNGLFEQTLLSEQAFLDYVSLPGSFYADLRVDRIAKAVMDDLADMLFANRRIDREFVARYIDAASVALGQDCSALDAEMNQVAFVLTETALEPAQRLVQQRLATSTSFSDVVADGDVSRTAAMRYPALPVVAVTTRDNLYRLDSLVSTAHRKRMRTALSRHDRYVMALPRPLGSTLYLIGGVDRDQAAAALLQWLALRPERFEGDWLPPALPDSVPD